MFPVQTTQQPCRRTGWKTGLLACKACLLQSVYPVKKRYADKNCFTGDMLDKSFRNVWITVVDYCFLKGQKIKLHTLTGVQGLFIFKSIWGYKKTKMFSKLKSTTDLILWALQRTFCFIWQKEFLLFFFFASLQSALTHRTASTHCLLSLELLHTFSSDS